ncbi:unnamed protein product [Closterium sp. NIES-53]
MFPPSPPPSPPALAPSPVPSASPSSALTPPASSPPPSPARCSSPPSCPGPPPLESRESEGAAAAAGGAVGPEVAAGVVAVEGVVAAVAGTAGESCAVVSGQCWWHVGHTRWAGRRGGAWHVGRKGEEAEDAGGGAARCCGDTLIGRMGIAGGRAGRRGEAEKEAEKEAVEGGRDRGNGRWQRQRQWKVAETEAVEGGRDRGSGRWQRQVLTRTEENGAAETEVEEVGGSGEGAVERSLPSAVSCCSPAAAVAVSTLNALLSLRIASLYSRTFLEAPNHACKRRSEGMGVQCARQGMTHLATSSLTSGAVVRRLPLLAPTQGHGHGGRGRGERADGGRGGSGEGGEERMGTRVWKRDGGREKESRMLRSGGWDNGRSRESS